MAAGADVEIIIGLRNAHLLKKHFIHLIVIMLTTMDD